VGILVHKKLIDIEFINELISALKEKYQKYEDYTLN